MSEVRLVGKVATTVGVAEGMVSEHAARFAAEGALVVLANLQR